MLAGAWPGLASTLSYHKLRLSKLHTVVSLPGGDGSRPGQREAAAVEQVLKDQGRREDRERETGRSQEKEGGEGHSVTGRGKLIQVVAVLCWICSLLSLWNYTCPHPHPTRPPHPRPPPPHPRPGRSNLIQTVKFSLFGHINFFGQDPFLRLRGEPPYERERDFWVMINHMSICPSCCAMVERNTAGFT